MAATSPHFFTVLLLRSAFGLGKSTSPFTLLALGGGGGGGGFCVSFFPISYSSFFLEPCLVVFLVVISTPSLTNLFGGGGGGGGGFVSDFFSPTCCSSFCSGPRAVAFLIDHPLLV